LGKNWVQLKTFETQIVMLEHCESKKQCAPNALNGLINTKHENAKDLNHNNLDV
jgi:hypothetical protein